MYITIIAHTSYMWEKMQVQAVKDVRSGDAEIGWDRF